MRCVRCVVGWWCVVWVGGALVVRCVGWWCVVWWLGGGGWVGGGGLVVRRWFKRSNLRSRKRPERRGACSLFHTTLSVPATFAIVYAICTRTHLEVQLPHNRRNMGGKSKTCGTCGVAYLSSLSIALEQGARNCSRSASPLLAAKVGASHQTASGRHAYVRMHLATTTQQGILKRQK